jgi:hypothetical protein
MSKRLRHDIAYAAVQALLDQEWMERLADLRPSVAFDLYHAFKAVLESYEIQKAGEYQRLHPSNN